MPKKRLLFFARYSASRFAVIQRTKTVLVIYRCIEFDFSDLRVNSYVFGCFPSHWWVLFDLILFAFGGSTEFGNPIFIKFEDLSKSHLLSLRISETSISTEFQHLSKPSPMLSLESLNTKPYPMKQKFDFSCSLHTSICFDSDTTCFGWWLQHQH